MTSIAPSLKLGGDQPTPLLIRDLYTRMLFTRIVDDYTRNLRTQGFLDFVASCRGHEATQIGSAVCIEVGKDFTLPYYRDLGVVLTIGMTPHEVFRTYLQNRSSRPSAKTDRCAREDTPFRHWGYHKHNTVTGPAPVATQLLHAAGIAFACKLRKASVVTVAYCGDDAITEPDFLEGLRFAVQHQLPAVFICELAFLQQPKDTLAHASCLDSLSLPAGLTHQQVDGTDVVAVYQSTHAAMRHARAGHGPVLLEMRVVRPIAPLMQYPMADRRNEENLTSLPASPDAGHSSRTIPNRCSHRARPDGFALGAETSPAQPLVLNSLPDSENTDMSDPLVRCRHYLQMHGAWDDNWANQLCTRISTEIECAWHDVLHDALQSSSFA